MENLEIPLKLIIPSGFEFVTIGVPNKDDKYVEIFYTLDVQPIVESATGMETHRVAIVKPIEKTWVRVALFKREGNKLRNDGKEVNFTRLVGKAVGIEESTESMGSFVKWMTDRLEY